MIPGGSSCSQSAYWPSVHLLDLAAATAFARSFRGVDALMSEHVKLVRDMSYSERNPKPCSQLCGPPSRPLRLAVSFIRALDSCGARYWPVSTPGGPVLKMAVAGLRCHGIIHHTIICRSSARQQTASEHFAQGESHEEDPRSLGANGSRSGKFASASARATRRQL